MYFVIEDRVYSAAYDEVNNHYPLVSVAMAADGAVTVTDEGEGVAVIPAGYRKCSLEEVIAIFAIVPEGEYEPPATITGNDPVTVYLDEANKAVTLVAANPSAGTFSGVASDDTGVATVTASDGTVTIVPVGVGACNVTITFTPTDTNFAASEVTIPVTVAKRQIEIAPVRNFSLAVNTTREVALESNVAGVAYTVLSSDSGICAVSETNGTLTLTPAASAPLGLAIISVAAVLANGKADDSAVMKFRVRVCASAVTITEIGDASLEVGTSDTVTVVSAGAEIREVVSSDETVVTVEKTGKLELTITAVGDAAETADITVYCDKRGHGEGSDTFKVTLTAAT